MNNKYKALLGLAMAAPLLTTTGCIEEPIPTSIVTAEQIEGSAKATEAIIMGMPAHLNTYYTISSSAQQLHFDFGNPATMHARDVMTEDEAVLYGGGYDWFAAWSSLTVGLDPLYTCPPFFWTYYYEQVLACNQAVAAVTPDMAEGQLGTYRAMALAFRAATYLDMARQYEFLPNENVAGDDVIGLTCPIVTENTTEEDARHNPRVPHDEMVEFIKKDLQEAIDLYIECGSSRSSKTLPNLAVAYGLMARLYLWDASYVDPNYNTACTIHAGESEGNSAELYAEAAKYARLAIDQSGATPLNRGEWTNATSGFNDINVSSWMWGQQYVAEDGAIKSGIVNWASFCINEQTFGYASVGAWTMIGASLYNRISDRDFRKLSWVAPKGSALSGQESYVDPEFAAENFDEYYAIKFRPGSGNMDDPSTGAVVGVPLMRVEEMYLLEAEAVAHTDEAKGKGLLEKFMQTYRYSSYRCLVADVIDEIILQKRIELWGEGLTYFDVKRLNMSVTRYYPGTNFDTSRNTYNTVGRPFWMNLVMPATEERNNTAFVNNPSVVQVMTPIK